MARRKNRGSTAVEFALIATPFVFMIFALIETMLVFFTQTTLEAAVAEESRKIRTGQAHDYMVLPIAPIAYLCWSRHLAPCRRVH
ncbi:MAG: TadE family protein [Hyphomonadaceae bacterium]|nr:MAG: TadE family protein [Hyphomonadaceae bacterium]